MRVWSPLAIKVPQLRAHEQFPMKIQIKQELQAMLNIRILFFSFSAFAPSSRASHNCLLLLMPVPIFNHKEQKV